MREDEGLSRYQGKRFAATIIGIVFLFLGLLVCVLVEGAISAFSAYSLAIIAVSGGYVTGQSWTDNTKAKNGHEG